jgi:hypothetical protein
MRAASADRDVDDGARREGDVLRFGVVAAFTASADVTACVIATATATDALMVFAAEFNSTERSMSFRW